MARLKIHAVAPGYALTAAFVLRSHAYGESDRIVSFITEDFGKVSGIAKGAMRSRRRFVNTLEPFVKIRLAFRMRPTSDLAFIERCDLIEILRGFGNDLDRFACGSYVLELVDQLVMGREPGTEIFRLVETTLSTLDSIGYRPSVVRAFELHVLEAIGYRPDLTRCRVCGRRVSTLPSVLIVPGSGGIVCLGCRPATGATHALTGQTLAMLADLQRHPISAAASWGNDQAAAAAEAALEGLIANVINRPLRSPAVLSALRQPASAC